VTYRLVLDEVLPVIKTLPLEALRPLPETWAFLELTPWAGRPWVDANPTGALRMTFFDGGRGTVIYVILEDQRRVDVIDIWWT
jgi:hypothetical protein